MIPMLADAYLHNLDPFAIEPIIRWYGLAYAIGFLLGWMVLRWFATTGRSPLTPRELGDLVFYVIAGVLIGGRLGHVIFYSHGRPFIEFDSDFPFWGVLKIHEGGMASHGGILGFIIACFLFGYRRNISPIHLCDLGAFAGAPGLFLGRLANFVNAELWGKPVPPSMQANPPWWSVKYPTQIYERWLAVLDQKSRSAEEYTDLVRKAAADFDIQAPASELPALVQKEAMHRLDQIEPLRAILPGDSTFYANVVDAAKEGHLQVVETLRPLLTAYYPSQIFQAISDGPVLMGVLALIWLKPRKPGVVGCWFLISYGVLRILTEAFRQPDEGVPLLLGLSRGQALSVLMVVVGFAFLPWVTRRPAPKYGGLLAKPERLPVRESPAESSARRHEVR